MKHKEFQDFYSSLVGGNREYLFSQCTTKAQQDTYGLNIGDYLNDRVQFVWVFWQEQQKKFDEALLELKQKYLELNDQGNDYEDPVSICQAEGVDISIRILEKALQGNTNA